MKPSKKWLAAGVVAVTLLAGVLLTRWWLGPSAAGYQIEARPLVQTLVATGRLISVSRVQVGSEITGVVLERRVIEGDKVKPGDILLVLRADELAAKVREAEAALVQLERSARPQAQATLRQAQAQLAQASREAQRRQQLLKRQLIGREAAEQAVQAETTARAAAEKARLSASALAPGNADETVLIERLASARAMLEKTTIRAEVSGTLLIRNVEPGDLVQPSRVLLEIARDGDTEVIVPLDEKNLAVIEIGQPASCIADAFPHQPFKASISFIAPSVDPQKGTVDIRLKVDPVPENLRQDMTVSANIETGRRENALVIPNDALFNVEGERANVLSVTDGRVKKVPVRLGLRGLVMTEIISGLKAGDWVLADTTAKFNDGDRVRIQQQPKAADEADTATKKEPPVNFQ